jgi:hypothetical protein
MPKIFVVIEWDEPEDQEWLNPFNIELALSAHCENTVFEVREVKLAPLIPEGEEKEGPET